MSNEIISRESSPEPRMGMMLWLATEGGRKCPQCGRYARPGDLGHVGGPIFRNDRRVGTLDAYGHMDPAKCGRGK